MTPITHVLFSKILFKHVIRERLWSKIGRGTPRLSTTLSYITKPYDSAILRQLPNVGVTQKSYNSLANETRYSLSKIIVITVGTTGI